MIKNQNDDQEQFRMIYGMMAQLWASGIRSYQNLSSAYLVANSILVTTIVVMLRSGIASLNIASLLFSAMGFFLCWQMVSALQICLAENRYWEERLRKREDSVEELTVFSDFHSFRKKESACWDTFGIFPRMKGIPFIFMALYVTLFIAGITVL